MSFTDEKIKQLRAAFDVYDKDANGKITLTELRVLMESVGLDPTEAHIKNMLGKFDDNKNQALEFNEFLALMKQLIAELADPNSEASKRMRATFNMFDKDGNGTINVKELGDIMKQLGKNKTVSQLQDILKQNDVNNDGVLNYDEFLKLLALA